MKETNAVKNAAAVGGSLLQRLVLRLLCATIGHRMRYTEFETRGIGSPAECTRCGHRQPGIEWPKPPPMPKVKPPFTEGKTRGCIKEQNNNSRPVAPPPAPMPQNG